MTDSRSMDYDYDWHGYWPAGSINLGADALTERQYLAAAMTRWHMEKIGAKVRLAPYNGLNDHGPRYMVIDPPPTTYELMRSAWEQGRI